MFDKPIKTVEQAKEYFRAMGCSHFHMGREYPQRYDEYRNLNIPKRTETEWRQEQFDEYYRSIMKNTDDSVFWNLHSRMYDLFENIRTGTALVKMLEVTQHLRDKVPLKDRVIVAETINGRRIREARGGLIYLAYDLNNIPAAKAFAELSLHFSEYVEQKTRNLERCQKATKLCNDIKLELGL